MNEETGSKFYECCIIGAGPAGLGAALELLRHGVSNILLIDRNKIVGGLSRTDTFDGVRFDIGPHRFFTKNSEVNKIWHDTLGKDFFPVSRLTRIYFKNKYFYYPIRPFDVLRKLHPRQTIQALLSFSASQMRKKSAPLTFEDWIIQKFGRTLYEIFFKVYTEKIWGIPCSQISAQWAMQRIKGLDALEVIRNALLGRRRKKIKTLVEEFDFPVLGAGQMYEALYNKISAQGVESLLNSRVVAFNRQDNRIQSIEIISGGNPMRVIAGQFFSSIPLRHLFEMLSPPESCEIKKAAGMLRYRDHITVDLLVKKKKLFPDQWIYVHSPEVQMARIANYNNFSEAMTGDENKTALSVEYFVSKGEGLWNESDEFIARLAIEESERMGLLKTKDVEKSWVVRETEAYPAYYLGFQDYYSALKSRIGQFSNLYPIGRAGLHIYNNQDHSLMSGMLAARNYLKLPDSPYVLWDINIDADYQENALRRS